VLFVGATVITEATVGGTHTTGFAVGPESEGGFHVGFKAEVEIREHDVAVFAQENVLGFEVAIDDSERVEVLEGDEDLGGEETRYREGKAVVGLFAEEGVEVAGGAVVHEEARVVGDIDARVERGEEGMVERVEDFGFGFRVGEFFGGEEVFVDDFEGEVGAVVVAEAAEEYAAEVAGAEVAEELKMAEVEAAVGGEHGGGLDGGPVGVGAPVGATVDDGDAGLDGGDTIVETECEAACSSEAGSGAGAVGGGAGKTEIQVCVGEQQCGFFHGCCFGYRECGFGSETLTLVVWF